MIGHMLRQGLFAFAQIETWNEKSLSRRISWGCGFQKKGSAGCFDFN